MSIDIFWALYYNFGILALFGGRKVAVSSSIREIVSPSNFFATERCSCSSHGRGWVDYARHLGMAPTADARFLSVEPVISIKQWN